MDDATDEGKTDAVAGVSVGEVTLVKFFENPSHDLAAHADAVIRDRHGDIVRLKLHGDADTTALRGEFDCVTKQVPPDEGEHLLVSVIQERLQLRDDLQLL